MAQPRTPVEVYLEVGKKRVIAGALDWPGWCRIGRDEAAALQALAEYWPRYAQVLGSADLGFPAPAGASAFVVVERLEGNTTTDFGAPDVAPAADAQPVGAAELERLQALLRACWHALDKAAQAAAGHELRKGPRGGGRDLGGVVDHVMHAEQGYLARLAWKRQPHTGDDELRHTQHQVLAALAAAARGETPKRGPRGGVIWSPRYFVRRVAWHVLDHAWELEDRRV